METKDGKIAHEDFANYRRLRDATKKQRRNFILEGFGIRWPDVDEDLSFDGSSSFAIDSFISDISLSISFDLLKT